MSSVPTLGPACSAWPGARVLPDPRSNPLKIVPKPVIVPPVMLWMPPRPPPSSRSSPAVCVSPALDEARKLMLLSASTMTRPVLMLGMLSDSVPPPVLMIVPALEKLPGVL